MLNKPERAWRLLGYLLVLAIFVLGAAGCGGNSGSEQEEKVSVYTVADPTGDWGFPSPYAHYARGPGYLRMSFIFDTLVWKDAGGYIPALAESWEYIKDEEAYLFRLRQNVTWHDGQKFTAKDVVFTVNYTKQHPYPWVDTGVIKDAQALDEYTVKMYMTKPYAAFLELVGGTLPVLPEHVWKDVQDPQLFQEKKALTGTGPYKLVDYNKEHGTYLFEANEHYYQGAPGVKQLKFVKIGGEVSAAALRQGQASVAQVPPEIAVELEKEGYKLLKASHDWVAKLAINHQKAPLDKKEFRQALAYAIDRRALINICLRGYALAGSPGLVPPDSAWYNPHLEGQYTYDPEKAAELLAGLGYTKKENFFEKDGRVLELELLVSGGSTTQGAPGEREGEFIKKQLEQLGIKINLRSLEAKTLDNRVLEKRFDLALIGHGGLGGDPGNLKNFIIDRGFNSAGYVKNEELNNLLEQQLAEMDKIKRQELIDRIQKLYASEMPALPLYYPSWYYAHDGQVNLFFTMQGIGSGVPLPYNKMAFVR